MTTVELILLVILIALLIGFIITLVAIRIYLVKHKKHLGAQQQEPNGPNHFLEMEQLKTYIDNRFIQNLEPISRTLPEIRESIKSIGGIAKFNETKTVEINTSLKNQMEIIRENLQGIIGRTSSIPDIKTRLQSIYGIFQNSKNRGTFGEYSLEAILENCFGAQNLGIWNAQVKLPSENIIDFTINLKDHVRVGIDSKFPLENFNKIENASSDNEKLQFRHSFEQDVKNMITSLNNKYISSNDLESVIMYVPSESVYHFLCTDTFPKLFDFALKNKIYLCSPTTISIVLYYFKRSLDEQNQIANWQVIIQAVKNLELEFSRWVTRWDKYYQETKKLLDSNIIHDLDTTNKKLGTAFKKVVSSSADVSNPKVITTRNNNANEDQTSEGNGNDLKLSPNPSQVNQPFEWHHSHEYKH